MPDAVTVDCCSGDVTCVPLTADQIAAREAAAQQLADEQAAADAAAQQRLATVQASTDPAVIALAQQLGLIQEST